MTSECQKCIYTDCVAVCPVDAFYLPKSGEYANKMLMIHPEECIDCAACEPECPSEAIREEGDAPEWAEKATAYFEDSDNQVENYIRNNGPLAATCNA